MLPDLHSTSLLHRLKTYTVLAKSEGVGDKGLASKPAEAQRHSVSDHNCERLSRTAARMSLPSHWHHFLQEIFVAVTGDLQVTGAVPRIQELLRSVADVF